MSRRYMAFLPIVVILLFSLRPALCLQDAKSHYHMAGPLAQLMEAGVKPGPATNGLAFTLVLGDAGASITPASVELRSKSWRGAAQLNFMGLQYKAGQLTGQVGVQNNAGGALGGLRFDITGAAEQYKDKDAQGKETIKSRSQTISVPTPLVFGDVPTGQASDVFPFMVTGLSFHPETVKIELNGILSGLYYMGTVALSGFTSKEIAVDSKGRVYLGCGDTPIVADAEIGNAKPFGKAEEGGCY